MQRNAMTQEKMLPVPAPAGRLRKSGLESFPFHKKQAGRSRRQIRTCELELLLVPRIYDLSSAQGWVWERGDLVRDCDVESMAERYAACLSKRRLADEMYASLA